MPRLAKPRRRHNGLRLALETLEDRRVLVTTLPAGFVETPVVTSGISNPTAMEFAPDGRLFVAQQTGQLRVIKNGSLLATPFISLTVNSSSERGLLGIAFDPDFGSGPGQNQFIYLYYTATTPTIHNRVSRFTANGDVVMAGSEVPLLDLPTLGAGNHNGGAIHFGPDGYLYIAVGENAVGSNAPSLNSPLGKMLRIAKDGTIPDTNPFFETTTGINQAIWARGLRNPFTFDFHAQTGRMFINDVGQNTWEEINDGIAGANYGWPSTEGETTAAGITSPLYVYQHGNGTNFGRAIAGAAFYDSPTKQFPADYDGDYFFADYVNSWIKRYDVATDTATLFGSNMTAGNPVDLKVDSSGALYYLAKSGAVGVYKITFPQGQTAPVITDQPDDATVTYGQSALFSVAVTAPGPVTYQWRKENVVIPGATGSNYLVPSATLADEGLYNVIVADAFGSTTSASARLTVKSIVAGRHIFYNGSDFDLDDPAANAADDLAIATDKSALLPGSTASFANYTSYNRGINGIMVDIAGLPATTALTAGDFEFKVGNNSTPSTWEMLANAPTVSVRPGAGAAESSRVTLIWQTGQAAIRQWLQVTVEANSNTGLASPDVFYFGNAVGESGNVDGDFSVSIIDELLARNNPVSVIPGTVVTNRFDYNRDGTVSVIDQLLARNNLTTVATKLQQITAPSALAASGLASQDAGARQIVSIVGLTVAGPSIAPRSVAPAGPEKLLPVKQSGSRFQPLSDIDAEGPSPLGKRRGSAAAHVDNELLELLSRPRGNLR